MGTTVTRRESRRQVRTKAGIWLEVALQRGEGGPHVVQLTPEGDVPHDPRRLPWPLSDDVATTVVIDHVLEFLAPEQWWDWWTEVHRVCRPHATVYVSGPYGGDENYLWLANPLHRIRVVEGTFEWLDPRHPLYQSTRPPFQLKARPTRAPKAGHGITYQAILEARPWAR